MKKQKNLGVSKKSGAKKGAIALGTPGAPAGKSTASSAKIMPLGDRVLVKPLLESEAEAKNNFGIIIPDTVSKEQSEQGKIVAVGEGKYVDGKLVPIKVKVGDTVIFSKYGFDEVKSGDDELYILKEENILAIVKK